jgi:tetratricopeptide (TPR) repeat protein
MLRTSALLTLALAIGQTRASADPIESTSAEADRALAEGRFQDAVSAYRLILNSSPQDRHALREAGRAAHALQDFATAADLLTRADELSSDPDPELHFLLGEAYWVLHRDALAIAAQRRALAEIGDAPAGRLERLWLARIESRFGNRGVADALYDQVLALNRGDAEAAIAQVEMHAAAREWDTAEQDIRRFLARDPSNGRMRALLAWVDEARGDVTEEVTTRETLAHRPGADKDSVRDYGRALERSGDWAGARDAYARAIALPGGHGDTELARSFERMDGRMSVEVGAGGVGRTDPIASSYGGYTGLAVPFGPAHHISILAWQDRVFVGSRAASAGEVLAAMTLRGLDAELTAGATAGMLAGDGMTERPLAGVTASASSGMLFSHLKLTVDGQLNSVWHETPAVELLGGSVDAATAHVYVVTVDNRVIFDSGEQLRQLRLTGMATPTSNESLTWTGVDFVAWRDFSHEASGQILDDNLLRSTYAADSAVISYRHYEMFDHSDQMFGALLAISPRASIDEVSATARKVIAHGRIAAEARGGVGHDWIRELAIAHGGASLWLAPSRNSRLSLSFDIAKESTGTFQGERRVGWVTYHVDL